MILNSALNYIEKNLFEEINYDDMAKTCHTNKFNLMRVFSASTDYTLAEYIRIRRMSVAGKIISETTTPIIQVGFDCGYQTAESFSKAYKKFHGLSPSETRKTKQYKVVPEWKLVKGKTTEYEITAFKNTPFIGYGTFFQGRAENRGIQDEKFFVSTRREQDALRALRADGDYDWWEILDNFNEHGFELSCAVKPDDSLEENSARSDCSVRFDYAALARKTSDEKYDNVFDRESLEKILNGFNTFKINGKYARFVSENKEFPMDLLDKFTKTVYSGIDEYDFTRDETRPELLRIHWYKRENIKERHLEIYIPVK